MFEKITIRSQINADSGIDIGTLCEILLFYGKVHIISEGDGIRQLLAVVGPDNLGFLIKNDYLRITYFGYNIGTQSKQMGPSTYYDFNAISALGDSGGRRWHRSQIGNKQIDRTISELKLNRDATKVLEKNLVSNIEIINTPDELKIPNLNPLHAAAQTLNDEKALKAVAKTTISYLAPTYRIPHDFYFKTIKTKNGYVVDSNLNTPIINKHIKQNSGHQGNISHSLILGNLLEANYNLTLTGHYGSEMLVNPMSSKIISAKVENLFNRVKSNEEEIHQFSSIVFENGFAIRDVINSGERTFDEFIHILERSKRFRNFIADQKFDASLIGAYTKEVGASTWVEGLASRTARFSFLTGVGFVLDASILGGLFGVSLNAVDHFLVEKTIKGWRPNQFINGQLRPFIQKE